ALAPELPEALQPDVDLLQRCRPHRVEPPRAVRPDGDEPRLPEHPQVLRHGGWRHAELCLDDLADGARGPLARGEQLQYPASHRVAENVERVHPQTMPVTT